MIFNFSPPVIAHRGACAYAPENTMISFMYAAQLGIKWVEFDVMLAKCGTPIIFHDETLDRTTSATGAVDAFPYAHLCTLDAGKWFNPIFASERIPTLENVMRFLQEAGMSANVEIKPMPGKEEWTVRQTLEVLKGIRMPILFSSFCVETLRYLRQYAPRASIGLLLERWEPNWEVLCHDLNCVSVHVDETIVTNESARKVKEKNKYLLCYTVNNPIRAKALFKMGVDAVFSDCPDLIEKELVNVRA